MSSQSADDALDVLHAIGIHRPAPSPAAPATRSRGPSAVSASAPAIAFRNLPPALRRRPGGEAWRAGGK